MWCVTTDAMADNWKTIRVPEDVYENAKQRKEEHDVTWGEYVNPNAWHSVFDAPDETPDMSMGDVESVLDASKADMSDLADQLDEIQRVVEQNNGALGDTVNDALEIGEHHDRRIQERLDEIEELLESLGGVSYDDVRAACGAAVREELEDLRQ
jgi:tetrahydromethanopterin S-methyltransferase subunit G